MATTLARRLAEIAPLPLRVTLGIIMVSHGQQKVFGEAKQQFPTFVESLGVPEAGLVAKVVSNLEFFGGLALIVGLMTRLVALLFTGEFLYILFRMKWSQGFRGFEFDLSLLG
ncbi:MAG: DoxX family protein, partial [Thermomicrobiaceae bacterium]|nr:DoxX family protein [Thermomicrobiaceae bacterium]